MNHHNMVYGCIGSKGLNAVIVCFSVLIIPDCSAIAGYDQNDNRKLLKQWTSYCGYFVYSEFSIYKESDFVEIIKYYGCSFWFFSNPFLGFNDKVVIRKPSATLFCEVALYN